MPAIDNTRVRAEATELVQYFDDPAAFMRPLRRMLLQHADPALRQSLIVASHSPLNGYGTPVPVLKTIRNMLRKPIHSNPLAALALADTLWAAQSREERWLAAELLGLAAGAYPDDVIKRLEQWVRQVDYFEVADALATSAGGPWLRTNPLENMKQISIWLTIGNKFMQRYAVMCLVWLADDRSYGDVVAILDVLPGSLYEVDVEVRKAIARLLRKLTLKNAGQVLRLLHDWANTLDRNAHWVVRHSLDNLDADTRNELLLLLRGRG